MPVIADLDIYSRVGKAVAYDEVVPFSVDRGQLFVSDGSVDFDGTLSIQFMKVSRDKKFSRGGGDQNFLKLRVVGLYQDCAVLN